VDDYKDVDEPNEYPGHYHHRVLRTRGAVVCARIITIISERCPGVFSGLTGRQVRLLERDIAGLLDEAFESLKNGIDRG